MPKADPRLLKLFGVGRQVQGIDLAGEETLPNLQRSPDVALKIHRPRGSNRDEWKITFEDGDDDDDDDDGDDNDSFVDGPMA